MEIISNIQKNIIDNSQTRVLAFLNIVGEGMRVEAPMNKT